MGNQGTPFEFVALPRNTETRLTVFPALSSPRKRILAFLFRRPAPPERVRESRNTRVDVGGISSTLAHSQLDKNRMTPVPSEERTSQNQSTIHILRV